MNSEQIVKKFDEIGQILSQNENTYEKANADLVAGNISVSDYKNSIFALINSCRELESQMKDCMPQIRGQAKRSIKDCLGMNRKIIRLFKKALSAADLEVVKP